MTGLVKSQVTWPEGSSQRRLSGVGGIQAVLGRTDRNLGEGPHPQSEKELSLPPPDLHLTATVMRSCWNLPQMPWAVALCLSDPR